jgi:hypothetical protein
MKITELSDGESVKLVWQTPQRDFNSFELKTARLEVSVHAQRCRAGDGSSPGIEKLSSGKQRCVAKKNLLTQF